MNKLVFKLINITLMTSPLFSRYMFERWNKLKFKLCGVKSIDNFKSMSIYNGIYLRKFQSSFIQIGRNFVFTSGGGYNPICRNIKGCIYIGKNGKLLIGDNVGISSSCIWADKLIKIGNNVKIGGNCVILDNNCHSLDFLNRRNVLNDKSDIECKEVIIEDDVLIGANCILLKGVKIGARAVIGAGSVITRDIHHDTIACGNPCKVIKKIYKKNGTSED